MEVKETVTDGVKDIDFKISLTKDRAVIAKPDSWLEAYAFKGDKYDKIVEILNEINIHGITLDELEAGLGHAPEAHKTSHQDGGSDEISVAGLSGELADNQPPKSHDNAAHSTNYVATTGDETVAGIKTFSSIPVLPASDPSTDNQATRKLYVDNMVREAGLTFIQPDANCTYPSSIGAADTSIKFAAGSACSTQFSFTVPRNAPTGKTWYYQLTYLTNGSDTWAFSHYVSAYKAGDSYSGWNKINNVSIGNLSTTTSGVRYEHEQSIGAVVDPEDVVNISLVKTSTDTLDFYLAGIILYWR
jgi:hypothetical protein